MNNTLGNRRQCLLVTVYRRFPVKYNVALSVFYLLPAMIHDLEDLHAGGSVGCAVRLETRRSRVQPPPRSATFFRGD